MAKVAVIGTGYVGLTTGACMARLGHEVVCADVIPEKVANLQQGIMPILEDGLEELVHEGLENGRLQFVLGAGIAVVGSEFIFMCLPTPQGADGAADLSYVLEAAREIAAVVPAGAIVINKSTVPVGSAERVAEVLGRPDVAVASNPEFLREGTAVADFFGPDRVVIGANSPEVAGRVASLYEEVEAPKLLTDTATAELIKYASNAFLAAKISFANSIANLCEAVGANAHEVLEGMGLDQRIGKKFLQPGPGWGGSCFPKDTYALVHIAESAGYNFDLLRAVIAANDAQVELMVNKVVQLLDGNVEDATVAVWGLTFKAGTDDTRESPALRIAERLSGMGARVRAYDPGIGTEKVFEGIELSPDALAVCDDADVLAVLTEWPEFGEAPLEEAAKRLRQPRILDTRNMRTTEELDALGFDYLSVGRGSRVLRTT